MGPQSENDSLDWRKKDLPTRWELQLSSCRNLARPLHRLQIGGGDIALG
jgi:hypothetical protein